VAEAPTSGAFVRAFHDASAPGTFFFGRGGGLGWAMPAACGLALARGGRQQVLCAIGDGAAMYSPQALWTAARHRLPVLFAVFDNQGYAILRDTLDAWEGRSRETGRYVALELDDPRVDFVALAGSMGVVATTVHSTGELADAAAEAVASGAPRVIHIPIVAPHEAP
jgi:benzoylformate decarboxylase